MTVKEVNDIINAYNQREKDNIQKQASMHYRLANLIGESIGCLLDKNVKFPTLFEAYEGVFDKEIQEQYKKKQLEQQQKVQIERIKAMVLSHSNDYKKR